jgi:cob(I)alamin adenosyltransferase
MCHIVILHDAYAVAQSLAVHLSHNEPVAEIAITYLNRLSDYLLYWHETQSGGSKMDSEKVIIG